MELITKSYCAITGSKELEPLHEVKRLLVYKEHKNALQ